jgi:transcriptional regulator with XRE-family HTH domain
VDGFEDHNDEAGGVTLGQRLRQLRISGEHGYRSHRYIARAVGVDFVTWSHFEFDREQPELDVLARAADVLGADLAELLRLRDEWTEAPPSDLSRSICNGRRLG